MPSHRSHILLFTLLIFTFLVCSRPTSASLFPKSSSSDKTLETCGIDSDILTLHSIDIIPDPPERGRDATINAIGTLKEDIADGAKLKVQVKLGMIKLYDAVLDLCQQIQSVGKACPLPKGDLVISHTFDIPPQAPPGRYNVHMTMFTSDERSIGCVDAHLRL
ncbi:Phosphatidylglycerol/phosphatidylinositol transfer protein [Chytridiales sp. JEL 0842]|nr:Phosphatidylglycerol/phosphatidylinositol transfer protein [Chytridiales sp. JEL 0842]